MATLARTQVALVTRATPSPRGPRQAEKTWRNWPLRRIWYPREYQIRHVTRILHANSPLVDRETAGAVARRVTPPVRHESCLDVRDALGPGAADLSDQPGQHDDRDDVRGHQQQVRLDRRVQGGHDRLQLGGEAEQQRRRDRPER